MKGRRRMLSEILFRTGVLWATRKLRRDIFIILNYHRVLDPNGPAPLGEGGGPTPEEFESSIAWLKRHARILGEDEIIEHVRSGRGPKGPCVAITFDDGYKDNYTTAYPILRRLGVPATFFIPAGLIEERKVGWWDLIAYYLRSSKHRSIEFEGRTYDLDDDLEHSTTLIHRIMKRQMHTRADEILARLQELTEVDDPPAAAQDAELMTWEEIAEVSDRGIAIGSHTMDHPILRGFPERAQRAQLIESKALIESRIHRPVQTIAYPVGGKADFGRTTQRLSLEAGYALGYSYYFGWNRWGHIEPYDVRRTSLYALEPPDLAARLSFPEYL